MLSLGIVHSHARPGIDFLIEIGALRKGSHPGIRLADPREVKSGTLFWLVSYDCLIFRGFFE